MKVSEETIRKFQRVLENPKVDLDKVKKDNAIRRLV